jgi:GH35 family endo-1,4-beta-xylanase
MILQVADPEYSCSKDVLPLQATANSHWYDWFARRPHRAQWLVAFALLALAQVLFAGYEMGVGNQTIQIPFLRHWQNPALFAHDPVVKTAADYPTYFFRLLAVVIPGSHVAGAYFWLHLLTCFAVLATMAGLTRAMFSDRLSGGIVVLMLVAGHHHALAGDDFYSTGFTHTWAVFPLSIGALLLIYRGTRRSVFGAFILAGIIFNLHALTAAYLFAMFMTWAGWEVLQKRLAWRTAGALVGVFVLISLPTVVLMMGHHQVFDARWVILTRIRSSDHSFPSSWWAMGRPDIPHFALITALAGVSLSFVTDRNIRRKSLAIAAATCILFVVGTLFSEFWPWPVVMRAQLFRASRLFMVVAFSHIAFGIAQCLRRGFKQCDHDCARRLARRVTFVSLGLLALLTLSLPAQTALLPWLVLFATLVALGFGRLSFVQALVAAAALLISIVAWRTINFPLPGLRGLTAGLTPSQLRSAWQGQPMTNPLAITLVTGSVLWALSWLKLGQISRGIVIATGVLAIAAVTHYLYNSTGPGEQENDPWVRTQLWAKGHTPADAVFLTPIKPGGFRIYSDRAVVAEWRDGTQAYFTAAFASDWWKRMQRLQEHLQYDVTGQRLLIPGKPLETYDDEALIALCNSKDADAPGLGADYIVLPNSSDKHELVCINQNSKYSIYLPLLKKAKVPADTPNVDRWQQQEDFVKNVCLPNIEKYRKGDLKISVVDENGKAIGDLPFSLNQTRHAFGFGCSLPFFKRPDAPKIESFMPQQVDPRELTRFQELFNFSQIGFSGKWGYIESKEGQRDYSDLDLYLAFCEKAHATPEFHFLSGYEPLWLRRRPRAEQAARFLDHAKDMVTRYGARIPYWQVVNEQMLLEYSPPVFQAIRKINPDIKLGISHCAQFYSNGRKPSTRDMFRGLDDIKWLKSKGVKVDYFAFHGHRPFGVWPDARDMYTALDAFAKEGVRIHVSEFTVPQNKPIIGPVRSGLWNDQLQAEFYERYYTVCFSHPDVDVINMWGIGPNTWQDGSGLLDENYNPKPAFEVLKNLIFRKWHTVTSGTLTEQGSAVQRAFYGDYEITINLPNAHTVRGTFSFPARSSEEIKLRVNTQTGTLERI